MLRHSGKANLALLAGAAVLLLAMIVYLAPAGVDREGEQVSAARIGEIVIARCASCHAASPTQPGFAEAPLGIVLENAAQIEQYAERIAFTVRTNYMPIGNLTGMTADERTLVATWFAQRQP